ncbi:MAG TPA: hypothetical protein PKV92_08390, partial [Thermodesulfovibrio thiophilus]|nr:hypothetical protein [Thermodesulfovibrio thiophilus]
YGVSRKNTRDVQKMLNDPNIKNPLHEIQILSIFINFRYEFFYLSSTYRSAEMSVHVIFFQVQFVEKRY